ncbi:MAG: hypothetical protein RSE55_02470 [Lachnospiraceae bacterium]
MNKMNRIPLPVGGSSLLTIFAVLCLLTFSLLMLSTARADEKLSDKGQEAVTAYYKADVQAEQILSQIRKGEIPKDVKVKKNSYSYTCKISDTRTLFVKIRKKNETYQVQEWKEVSTTEWEPDDSMEIWDGTFD